MIRRLLAVAVTLLSVTMTVVVMPAHAQASITLITEEFCAPNSNAGECLNVCEAALNGYNRLFQQRPFIDLDAIKQRSITVEACSRIASNPDTSDELRSGIDLLIMLNSTDADTALVCARAINSTVRMTVGSPEYMSVFNQLGCNAFAAAAVAEQEDQRLCALERPAYDAVIESDDIAEIRRFDAYAGCREFKAQAYLRIVRLERDAALASTPSAPQVQVPQPQDNGVGTRDSEAMDAFAAADACDGLVQRWLDRPETVSAPSYADYLLSVNTTCPPTMLERHAGPAGALASLELCVAAEAVLNAPAASDDELTGAAESCGLLRPRVEAALARNEQARVAEATADAERLCARDFMTASTLVATGTLAELRAMFAATACSGLRDQEADLIASLCSRQVMRFGGHLFSRSDTAASLQETYDCPQVAGMINQRFEQIEALQNYELACQAERGLMEQAMSNRLRLLDMLENLQCEELRPLLRTAADRICADERTRLARFIGAGAGSVEDYRAALGEAQCADLQRDVARVIEQMDADSTCAAERLALSALPAGALDQLQDFQGRLQCAGLAGEVRTLIAQAETAALCEQERLTLAAIAASDVAALQAFQSASRCVPVSEQARSRILQAQSERCAIEADQLAIFEQSGSDLAELAGLEATLTCPQVLRNVALVRDRLAEQNARRAEAERSAVAMLPTIDLVNLPTGEEAPLPAMPQFSEQEVAMGVQSELQRLSCYSGSIDGEFGPRSRRASEDYGRAYKGSAQVRLPSLEFWEELQRTRDVRRCVAEQAPAPPARPQTAPAPPAPTPPAPSAPPPSAGGRGLPNIGGVGF